MTLTAKQRLRGRKRYEALGLPVPPEYQLQAPPGAKFKAIDCSGDAWFFDSEPKPKDWSWTNTGNVRYLGEVVCTDWVKSLRAI